jgi:hypothetical protein
MVPLITLAAPDISAYCVYQEYAVSLRSIKTLQPENAKAHFLIAQLYYHSPHAHG